MAAKPRDHDKTWPLFEIDDTGHSSSTWQRHVDIQIPVCLSTHYHPFDSLLYLYMGIHPSNQLPFQPSVVLLPETTG
jgi:hypothetical protein